MGAVLQWLSTPEGTAALGALIALTSVVLRYLPDTPLVVSLRSWFVDYAHRNVMVLPADVTARLDVEDDPYSAVKGAKRPVVVLYIGGKEVRRITPPPSSAVRPAGDA